MSDGQMLMDSIWELVGDPYGGQAEEWYEAASKVQYDLRRKHRQELLDELIAEAMTVSDDDEGCIYHPVHKWMTVSDWMKSHREEPE